MHEPRADGRAGQHRRLHIRNEGPGRGQPFPLGAAAELVKFAIDAGGMDNITAVLVPFPLASFPEEPPHPKTVPVRRVPTF